MTVRETYKVEIEGVTRELPLFAVGPEVRIAVFNLLGDTEIIGVAAEGLASRLAGLVALGHLPVFTERTGES